MERPATGEPTYLLGSSEGERRRLVEQDAFLGGFTRRLFLEAGIEPQMRVLDVVMMGHAEMWACMAERDAIYANPEASDDDYGVIPVASFTFSGPALVTLKV